MVLLHRLTTYFDILLQKVLRYKHHHRNYQENIYLSIGLIPSGLRLKKSSAFVPVMEDFNLKWNQILYDVENIL